MNIACKPGDVELWWSLLDEGSGKYRIAGTIRNGETDPPACYALEGLLTADKSGIAFTPGTWLQGDWDFYHEHGTPDGLAGPDLLAWRRAWLLDQFVYRLVTSGFFPALKIPAEAIDQAGLESWIRWSLERQQDGRFLLTGTYRCATGRRRELTLTGWLWLENGEVRSKVRKSLGVSSDFLEQHRTREGLTGDDLVAWWIIRIWEDLAGRLRASRFFPRLAESDILSEDRPT